MKRGLNSFFALTILSWVLTIESFIFMDVGFIHAISLLFALYSSIYYFFRLLFPKTFSARSNGFLLLTSIFLIITLFEIFLRGFSTRYTSYTEAIGHDYRSPYNEKNDKEGYHRFLETDSAVFYSTKEFYYKRNINSLGISEKEIDFKDTIKKKIACLGDSYTFGVGAAGDSSWPRVMERGLTTMTADTNIQTINCGIPGSDFIYQYHLFKDKILPCHPYIALFCVNVSDITDIMIRGGEERYTPKGALNFRLKKPWWDTLFGDSYIFRLIVMDIFKYNFFYITDTQLSEYKAQAYKDIEVSVKEISDTLAKRNVKAFFIIQPISGDIFNEADDFKKLSSSIKKNIPPSQVIEVRDIMRSKIKASELDKYYWKYDRHYNAKGYTVLGEIIASEVYKRVFQNDSIITRFPQP